MSEFSLIYRHFGSATPPHANTILGIGDDCAISQLPKGNELVSCLDTLVAGRHFPHMTSPHAIGYKSVAVNLSDLAAMGATPYAILMGISLPDHLANDAFCHDFAQGIKAACQPFGVELIGGDTTGSDILALTVTALGFIPQGQAIRRQGAKSGDLICVSGKIGLASFALSDILKGNDTPLRSALDYPTPQVLLGQALRGYASAMIDISDGLGQDLGHILSASGVGARLDLDQIPTDALLHELPNQSKWQHILNGGDDYQLCFTLSPDRFMAFQRDFPDLAIYPIGKIIDAQGLTLMHHDEPVEIPIKGWQHF
ncbi:thiamine-phosphate kinase [Moraxella catarrhalis]|uniref:Thiamine-monophosphate kinase n=1 Tax=Moraxella catarrhalis TaxID=480 RepID=A0A198UH55_MORCA|nr:thiamine-phosphate kinase [Moraxella catarrhalis]OAU95675.1 Thiamine-monophosphate kinase [Moraxella catarrhalis]OAU97426.1 Thiamine-monophosphate kinase [Moraxella catarrhalis]OAV01096.1 Thiamine-monophosphate kinase [Moraxella catarrhalis]